MESFTDKPQPAADSGNNGGSGRHDAKDGNTLSVPDGSNAFVPDGDRRNNAARNAMTGNTVSHDIRSQRGRRTERLLLPGFGRAIKGSR